MSAPQPPGEDAPVATIVVGPGRDDRTAGGVAARARLLGFAVDRIVEHRLVHVGGDLDDGALGLLVEALLIDPLGGWCAPADEHTATVAATRGVGGAASPVIVEVGPRPGVTDREAAELLRAAAELGIAATAASVGRRYVVHPTAPLDDDTIADLAGAVLHNDVVERWALDRLRPMFTDPLAKAPGVDVLALRSLDDRELVELSTSRRLGLTTAEMRTIADHFAELGRDPTDAELETLAQTWSEHCSHKTFRATIDTPDGPIEGLLASYLRAATEQIDAPWVRSAFVDNAGIVAFDADHDLAIKAETHNHPSALEPFGGANTGVGGVVRDILGVSAKPVAITDVLCFGPSDLEPTEVPDGVLHPRRIRSGVIAGVGDYGNKIGVPTIAGAIVHDRTYTTTPLVFAGCVGILPTGAHPTEPRPGDAIVVLGGAVGRDGVGGATFSSQSMGVETADVAGSSVQIGDPIVEKGLIDVVVAARDAGLYNAITDCGAGGLSSAVGEMADGVGAAVDLGAVPRKYPGLAPWEVWLSEAQERMVLAAPDPEPVLALAERWQVGAAVIGRFTGDGRLVVNDGQESVVDLDTGFLHDGRPPLRLTASDTSRPVRRPRHRPAAPVDAEQALLELLAHPSIRSNEDVVRTYDHEVLGGTIVRPYGGVDGAGPADGTVLVPPGGIGDRALAVGIGVNVVLGRYDAEAMAWAAVDEAVRNAVVAGADPARLSLLDNFSWGNPTRPDTLAALVAACRGCHDAAVAHGAPFVSGKDSLFNEFVGPRRDTRPGHTDARDHRARRRRRPRRATPHRCRGTRRRRVARGTADRGARRLASRRRPRRRQRRAGTRNRSHRGRSAPPAARGHRRPARPQRPRPRRGWTRRRRRRVGTRWRARADAHTRGRGRWCWRRRRRGWRCRGWRRRRRRGVRGRPRARGALRRGSRSLSRRGRTRRSGGLRRTRPQRRADRCGDRRRGRPPRRGDRAVTRRHRRRLSRPHRRPGSRGEPGSGRHDHREDATMTNRPSVLIPIAPGTNRNQELADAFELAGADTAQVPLSALRRGEVKLADHQLLAVPGGFSYGDALGAGRLLGLDLTGWFADQLAEAVARELPVIGICNGFQALVRAGLLPGGHRQAALVANESGRFECRWVTLEPQGVRSVWLEGLDGPLRCPVAHAEGRLVLGESAEDASEPGEARVAFRYVAPDGSPAAYPHNPNGSAGAAAGLVDASGLVLGLMPHPEDHVLARQDPLRGRGGGGRCLSLFEAGVRAVG